MFSLVIADIMVEGGEEDDILWDCARINLCLISITLVDLIEEKWKSIKTVFVEKTIIIITKK